MNSELFDLEHLRRTYFRLSLPITVSLLVTLIYNIADTYFISQTGSEQVVAGVSLCYPLYLMVMALGNVYAQGGSSLISRMLGNKDTDTVRRVSAFCFYIAILTGAVLGVLLLVFQKPMLSLMGAQPDTFASAQEYYVVIAFGAPLSVLNYVHSNHLRCEGLSMQSMAGSIAGSVVNIILDPIFISGLGMGAMGAAAATVIGFLVTDAMFLFFVLRKSRFLSIHPKYCRVNLNEWNQIISVGITAAILNIAQSCSVIFLNQFLLPYGTGKIAAMGIVQKVSRIPLMVLTGLTFGGIPLFGYLYGAGNYGKLTELIRFCLKLLCGFSLAVTVFLMIFAPMIMPFFLNTGTVVQDGIGMLRWQILGTVFMSVTLLMTVLFQAMGKAGRAFCLSVSRQGVVFILMLVLCSMLFGYTGILAGQFAADTICAVMALFFFRRTPELYRK